MTPLDLAEKILATNGRFFTVTFVKRSNGVLRRMTARLGVTRHLAGGPPAYDPRDHVLIWAWEVNVGYRSIPIEGILSLTTDGVTYAVENDQRIAA
jgi:hypothetical protein